MLYIFSKKKIKNIFIIKNGLKFSNIVLYVSFNDFK